MVSYNNTSVVVTVKRIACQLHSIPNAFVVMVTIVNATKEIVMIKHPTEQNHTHQTHGQKLLVF